MYVRIYVLTVCFERLRLTREKERKQTRKTNKFDWLAPMILCISSVVFYARVRNRLRQIVVNTMKLSRSTYPLITNCPALSYHSLGCFRS